MNYLARSAKRFQQQASQILSANPTPSSSAPLPLFHFPADADNFIVGSDADYRPASTSKVSLTTLRDPATGLDFVRFEGTTDGDGYAALRSKVPKSSFYGAATHDVSPYKFLTLRVRGGDARRYFCNLQTETYLETDLYQHRLFLTPRPAGTTTATSGKDGEQRDQAAAADGGWEDVALKLDDFTLTNNGQIQGTQVAMDKVRLKTVGISVLDRLPGRFRLDLLWIRAENEAGAAGTADGVEDL